MTTNKHADTERLALLRAVGTTSVTAARALEKRDAAITAAVSGTKDMPGWPLRTIAQAANVSHRTIKNIADRTANS